MKGKLINSQKYDFNDKETGKQIKGAKVSILSHELTTDRNKQGYEVWTFKSTYDFVAGLNEQDYLKDYTFEVSFESVRGNPTPTIVGVKK